MTRNRPSLWWFFNKVKRRWLASLKRRSQTARLSWERFIQFVARFFQSGHQEPSEPHRPPAWKSEHPCRNLGGGRRR
jgi:hypothetical protein